MIARGFDVQSADAKASNSISRHSMRHGFPARAASGTWYAQAHTAAYRAHMLADQWKTYRFLFGSGFWKSRY